MTRNTGRPSKGEQEALPGLGCSAGFDGAQAALNQDCPCLLSFRLRVGTTEEGGVALPSPPCLPRSCPPHGCPFRFHRAYNSADYDYLPVSMEIKELFQYIRR